MTRAEPTPAAAIHRAARIGKAAGLAHVYSGNIPGDPGENTTCPGCGRLLIGRFGFAVERMELKGSACPECGTTLEGVF